MLPTLRFLAVLIALCALAVTAGPASATAAKQPKPCPKGKVRLVARNGCLKLKRGPVAMPTAARGEARFARVARPKAAKRAKALLRAASAATVAPAKAARARAHAAGPILEDGEWMDVDLDGVPARQRLTTVEQEGATPTQTVTAETVTVQKVDGATVTISVTKVRTVSFDACPDADGVAHGRYETRTTERKEVVRGTERAFVEQLTGARGLLTAHFGDDALVASATYDGLVDFELRATGVPTRRYLVTWKGAAPVPSGPESDFPERLKRDPTSALSGVYRGPKGTRLTDQELLGIAAVRAVEQYKLEDGLRDLMRLMETATGEGGRCVDLILDPAGASMSQGETKAFSATAKAKDGTPVGGAAKAYALSADVTPGTATMTAGTPLKLDVTMGDQDKATLVVEVTSRRGVGSVLITIPRVSGWDVTFTASGSYAMQRDRGDDTDSATADLSWSTTFHAVRFDGGAYSPFGQTTIGGSMAQNGTLGTGTYSCTGTPWVMQAYNSIISPTPAPGGGVRIRIVPFTAVLADQASEQCTRIGYGGTYGNIDGITSTAPYEAHLTVTPEQLASGDFSVPVHRDADFTVDCPVGEICSQNGDMAGTVHFVRR